MRKGLAIGTGKGYRNVVGKDPKVHSQSAHGIKQPQQVNVISPAIPINKELPAFVNNKVLTESEILLLKRRLNDKKIKPSDIWTGESDKVFLLTLEQEKKGKDWLINLWKSPTGAERKNNPFGGREKGVLENFDHIELINFYDVYNAYNPEIKNYQPFYRVVGKDGNTFEYWAGFDRGSSFPIQILG